MNLKLSLVALAVMSAGTAQAASFNLNQAVTDNLDTSRWACKHCVSDKALGEVGLSALVVDSDDDHVANRFGDEDGVAAALQANVNAVDGDKRLRVQADNFGMETGRVDAAFRQDGWQLNGGYSSNLMVNGDDASSQYLLVNEQLLLQPQSRQHTLELKREHYFIGSQLDWRWFDLDWSGFVDYQLTEKTGKQVKSSQFIATPDANNSASPVQFVAPVDHSTHSLVAGGSVSGDGWLTELKYHGSQFDNGNRTIDSETGGNIQAYEPENEAHQMIASGLYHFDRHSLTGRVVKGWMLQDQDFTSLMGVPAGIQSADAEVETLDINARWHFRARSDLRLQAKVDYRDRDNKTPVRLFESIDFDPTTGRAVENVTLDSERLAYQVQANYRLMSGANVIAGYQRIDTEQTDEVTEETSEDRLFAQLRYRRLSHWDFDLKGEYSSRDGSDYQADAATSDEEQALLRKFYLADRDRSQLELGVSHSPNEKVMVTAKVRYALDDYSNTTIGLTESTDSSYDLSLNYQPILPLSLHLFVSQQWIDSEQRDLNGAQSYQGEINDSFSHIGFGGSYRGLLQDRLTLGLDYGYSESESDTELSLGFAYGDYSAWSHNVDLYAEYQLCERAKLKANYGYQRYYDTNYASVNSSSYVTLGNLDSNYVAHKVMLTFSYAL
ncbi:MtrB/PioB family decaheme-associated outer membrane protein [Ferrimonas senticii]|uniref:MtrB/PioB family decaheme-associated outer membrane protein n=1 Tax=Ferrimonas senticii TaxID=394566 RepID=UPI0004296913|nr:MtrB/PioB family decaheme-associated outer membrane protein [Ferrimonas senticii]